MRVDAERVRFAVMRSWLEPTEGDLCWGCLGIAGVVVRSKDWRGLVVQGSKVANLF